MMKHKGTKMISQETIAHHFAKNVDWQKFVNLAHSLGDQLNDAQWRFFKAIVFENSMESFSDGSVRYVGEEGCDLMVKIKNKEYRVEMKYMEGAWYTAGGKSKPRLRNQCKGIILMNSKGTNTHATVPDTFADFLLVVGLRGAAVIDKPTLRQYTTKHGDSIQADIPSDVVDFVFTPSNVKAPTLQKINLRQELNEAVRRTIAQIQ